ncbi:demethoxyubiquinone hydroxylase family protein [Rhodoferax sp.]|uniref:demethoxyubiquinone hydroxylase family protein n=1 Tax=Rhodoferax sp. TaxID=50421 RepID=UPI002ACDE33F|nr:demethoxyubiquinone hydroxylase family protein [Rhodoferax sp.]
MFDGSCPLCRREIGLYQSLDSLQPVQWLDVSEVHSGLEPAEQARLLARFHVRQADGRMLSGAAAFVSLWLAMPGWRWLGRFGQLPGVTPVLEWSYVHFLRFRPRLQEWMRAAELAHLPADMVGDLRSDHAGETGAVAVYRGMLWATRHTDIREFAQRHLQTEQEHLEVMNALLPPLRRSWLLPLWRAAGFVAGAVPALVSPPATYATVAAIETFVDKHYQDQLDRIAGRPEAATLLRLLSDCRNDEREHLEEASNRLVTPPGWFVRVWCKAIGAGSVVGVWLARRI